MSDTPRDTNPTTTTTDTTRDDQTPHPAKPGVKDSDKPVTTFGGEPIDGTVADVADGDV